MEYIYFGTIFTAMIIFFLTGTLLFLQRKNGERSRLVLAGVALVTMGNYMNQIIYFHKVPDSFEVMPVPLLLLGIYVITTYIMYPIEVISPGWLNWKRVTKIYIPFLSLYLGYKLTLWLGVEYTVFGSTTEMLHHIGSFEVVFRIVLTLLIFIPVMMLYLVPYTRRYNNSNHSWMRVYIIAVTINMVAFLLVINSSSIIVRTLYYAVSVSCSLCIVYQELFVRLMRRTLLEQNETEDLHEPLEPTITINPESEADTKLYSKDHILFEKLELYMNSTQAWHNPDLSAVELTTVLHTNRTSLREAIRQHGFSSYTSYVNGKRIEEFIKIVWQQNGFNYQQAFFDVGFRHKTTALRNFKEVTGMIPSEYFQQETTQKQSFKKDALSSIKDEK